MSNLTKILEKVTLPIGTVKVVSVGDQFSNAQDTIILDENGVWLRENGIYAKADYPELADQLGIIGGTNILYSTNVSMNVLYVDVSSGTFVAGNTKNIITSSDGVTWTSRSTGTASDVNTLIYGNGLFIYGGAGGALATSTDAITWTSRTSGTTSAIRSLTYGNGLYVYGGVGGVLATSTDAITWTSRTSGTTSTIYSLVYGNGYYLYGTQLALFNSPDAITWTSRTTFTNRGVYSLSYGNGTFVFGTDGLAVFNFPVGFTYYYTQWGASTNNGNTWNVQTSATVATINSIIYNQSTFYRIFLGDSNIYKSTDGITWTSKIMDLPNPVKLLYNNGKYFVFSASGQIANTSDFDVAATAQFYDTSVNFFIPKFLNKGYHTDAGADRKIISYTSFGRPYVYIKAKK